ncbi:MAG: thermonuclease family protein [Pyrinomonadaceae bacterium]
MGRTLAIAFLTLLCLALPASASTLQVRVVEVQDGKTIFVEHIGRRVKVVLKGADAPELDQPSGDVARQHLSSLVLGKDAVVEFTGMAYRSHFVARVFLDETDVSLQMIRDGAAWFDRSYEKDMNPAERRLYAESERAARNECRGIWQDPAPMPPWEWRQAKAIKQNSEPVMPVSAVVKSAVSKKADSRWPLLTLPNAPFSVRMPGNSEELLVEIQVPKWESINASFYWTRHVKIRYLAVWASGPAVPESVPALFDRALESLNQASAAHGLMCEWKREKDTSLNGYVGQRYKVDGCYLYGGLRLYYKEEGKKLRMCLVAVMSEVPNDPLADQFLESFVIHNRAKG